MNSADQYQIEVLQQAVSDQHEIEKIAASAIAAIIASRDRVAAVLVDLLSSYNGDTDAIMAQASSVISEIKDIREEAIRDASSSIRDAMITTLIASATWANESINNLLNTSTETIQDEIYYSDLFDSVLVKGRKISDWIDSIIDAEIQRASDALFVGLTDQQSSRSIVNSIIGTKQNAYREGAFSITSRDIGAVVFTAGATLLNEVKEGSWDQVPEIIGYKWVSVLDNRTSEICRRLDGHVIEIEGKGHLIPDSYDRVSPPGIRPPAHWHCRSILVPIFSVDDSAQIPKDIAHADLPEAIGKSQRAIRGVF